MIWENEPLPEIKEKLLEMKIKSVVFNPCGNTSEEGDYLSVMKRNIYNLKLIKN